MGFGIPLPLVWIAALGVLVYMPERGDVAAILCLAFVILYPVWRGIKFLSDRNLLRDVFMRDEQPIVVETHAQRRERFKADFAERAAKFGGGGASDARQAPPCKPDPVVDERAKCLHRLGLSGGATETQIRKAYRKLAKTHHPDLQQNEAAKKRASQRMLQINDAYDWLMANA
jgi:hypothetical protein